MKNLILIGLLFLATGCGSSSSNGDEKIKEDNSSSNDDVVIEDTIPPITTFNGENNSTQENNITVIENNSTQENNITVIENNSTQENNITVIENNSTQENNITAIELNSTQENNITVTELNITSCPTPIPTPKYIASKNYYLVYPYKQSKILSDVDLVTGQLSMTINDISANKRGMIFSRVYNSYDNRDKIAGTFQNNYDSHIDKEIKEQLKSRQYFTARDACQRGWRDISAKMVLKDFSDITVLYDDETTLCNIYTKGENNESQLRVSLLTKNIDITKNKKAHTLTRPNGETYLFYKKDNHWLTASNAPLKIEKINGNFIVTDANETIEEYNYYGNLVSLSRNNKTIKLFYDDNNRLIEIRDAFNQNIILGYNKDALLTQARSYDGTVVSYEYNDKKQLIKVIYPDGSSKSYTYDNRGRVIEAKGVNDCNKIEFAYANGETVVTQGVEQNSYKFKLLNSKLLTISITTDKGISTIEYDNYGYPLISKDSLGNITKTTYNRNGLLVEKIEDYDTPNEIVTTISYDDIFFGKPRIVKKGDISTLYLYSPYGELLQETMKANGVPDRVTTYGYDYRSHKIMTIKPNGGIISNEYDINGDKNSTIDTLGFTTEFNPFDSSGRALGSSDINEINSTTTYDAMGRILSRTKDSQTTTYLYDEEGREIKTTYPSGLIVEKSYDEYGNILTIENNKGEKRVNSYSTCGDNLLKTEIFKDEILIGQEEMEYDDKNRVIVKTDALGGQTHYSYNLQGEIETTTDALNRVTTYEYNSHNKLIKEIDSDGNTTTYSYNKNGEITGTILADGTRFKTSYDILGRVTKKDGISYSYDISDNILTERDTHGDTTTYTYDIANRKLTETHTKNRTLNESYEYDQGENAKGKLTKIINSQGEIEFKYDTHGNLITKTEMIGDNNFTTEFIYDDKNRLESKTYPDGKLVEYSYVKDDIIEIKINHRIFIKDIKRDQNGIISYSYANGDIHQKEYDLKGQLIKVIYPNYTKSITYNAVGEIIEITVDGEEYISTKEEEDLDSF